MGTDNIYKKTEGFKISIEEEEYQYETVREVTGANGRKVKIVRNKNKTGGLPYHSHSANTCYIGLDREGKFDKIREYRDHNFYKDIHFTHGFPGSHSIPCVHATEAGNSESRWLTEEEIAEYKPIISQLVNAENLVWTEAEFHERYPNAKIKYRTRNRKRKEGEQ